jgi:hypothetical protein
LIANKLKKIDGLMRKDLKILPWLTPEQAVFAICDMTKVDFTLSDLISHCNHHNCEAFILTEGLRGIATTPFSVGGDDWSYACFAYGPQRLINAGVLAGAKGMTKLCLQGTVREKNEEDALSFDDIEWEAEADISAFLIQFKPKDIEALAVAINGPAKALDPRERTSLYKLISALLAMTKLDEIKPGAVHAVLETAARDKGIEFSLDADTVAKHVNAAIFAAR